MLRRCLCPLALLLVSCGSTSEKDEEPKVEPTRPLPVSSELPQGGIVRTSRGTDFEAMVEELAEADIVYVGEDHRDADHHLVQLRIIEQLQTRGRLHGIGMEMFQRRFQPVLNDYVQARITEDELLERTDWKKGWGYDYALYRPILEFARRYRIPVIALNVDSEIRKIVRESGMDGLSDEQRRSLPALYLDDRQHRDYLARSYKQHLPEGTEMEQAKFEAFYRVMCLWDDVMADTVVNWFRAAPENAQFVVLAGNGHIRNRYGLPDRIHRRIGKRHKTVIPIAASEGTPDRDAYAESYADFLYLTGETE